MADDELTAGEVEELQRLAGGRGEVAKIARAWLELEDGTDE